MPDPTPAPPAAAHGRRSWVLGVGAVAAVAGLLLTAGATSAQGEDLRAERRSELADLVLDREQLVAEREELAAQLRTEVDELIVQGSGEALPDEEFEAMGAAGMTELAGPGITVALDDAPREPGAALPDGVLPDDLVVHQEDVQGVVNALWAGGAQGIQIMDQRIVSTSSVRCVGNTLILHGRVYAPPFTVTAVGDAPRLRAALDAAPEVIAYREWVDAVGLGYTVQDQPDIVLPPFDGSLQLSYAKGTR